MVIHERQSKANVRIVERGTINYVASVLELRPDVLSAMIVVWMIVVGLSLIVYEDARRNHIGPTPISGALTPGTIAVLIVWLSLFALQCTCRGVRD